MATSPPEPTDAELRAGIRQAAAEFFAAAEVWRHSPQWSATGHPARAYESLPAVRRALDGLAEDDPLSAYTDAVRPILGAWWPSSRDAEVRLGKAVEALRWTAVNRPSLVDDAHWLDGRNDT